MTQEEKFLSLQDLCARLPHKCQVFYEYIDDLDNKTYGYSLTLNTWCIDEFIANKAVIKPYLRPMSTMTDEEMDKYHQLYDEQYKYNMPYLTFCGKVADYLDSIHIDHRTIRDEDGKEKTMVELGLAIEAPKDMYEIKEK